MVSSILISPFAILTLLIMPQDVCLLLYGELTCTVFAKGISFKSPKVLLRDISKAGRDPNLSQLTIWNFLRPSYTHVHWLLRVIQPSFKISPLYSKEGNVVMVKVNTYVMLSRLPGKGLVKSSVLRNGPPLKMGASTNSSHVWQSIFWAKITHLWMK